MDRFEEAVMYCLSANGETFVAPQFAIGGGWSCPDFVAIRPPRKIVYVAEVTVSGYPTSLIQKINDRENQWLSRLREQLLDRKVIETEWFFRVLAFVRSDQLNWFKGRISEPAADVTVLAIEDAISSWEWNDDVWTSNFAFETDALKRAAQR